jgi:hypothetical protein
LFRVSSKEVRRLSVSHVRVAQQFSIKTTANRVVVLFVVEDIYASVPIKGHCHSIFSSVEIEAFSRRLLNDDVISQSQLYTGHWGHTLLPRGVRAAAGGRERADAAEIAEGEC